jgi:hypothetical protein
MSEQYGKIEEYKSFDLHSIGGKFTPGLGNNTYNTFNYINNYLKSKNGYIIHNFNTLNRQYEFRHFAEAQNNLAYSENIINAIDNFGNMYRNIYRFNFNNMTEAHVENIQLSNCSFQQKIFTHNFDNKLSNKSIKFIKCIDSCSEDSMRTLINYLMEDKDEDIHFMKNKNKELEDTNKDLLLKMDEMKEKHNELINKLMDRIADLTPKN